MTTATLATPALRTRKLTKRFGGFTAVNGVTLDIAPGSRQALIGPNGAGKTTLINLLTGILRPTEGRISLDEDDITQLPANQRVHRGLVRTFQINTLFPRLTPLQAASLAIAEREALGKVWWRTLRSCSWVADEAHALLAQFNLAQYAHVDTAELPYGKQRLLEIVLALAAKPRILLLDEPAAGVPEDESGELFEVIAGLPREMTVLFIEHDMDLVFRFAQRISVLVAGAVLVEGTPAEIAADPQVRAAYLGNSRV
ncbi:ABC transporter ATP-binding protein [Pigmentiphaga kullae]|uniref:Amino acid/amide ABC transporter ATP-binding protein 1 (HAAT family) n=1 Tax=Pigmentiphaga kullae TaxID=151784 RepID=A0A4Q7NJD7_9BURK|nr:ABC transporter ATP-binding protein [Pigmentiphaga kullae]RZS85181.1 amino acid/amide ABC transporter ATP-binding protein 1 (HAAT family) [Pigmentiphaga kullae]